MASNTTPVNSSTAVYVSVPETSMVVKNIGAQTVYYDNNPGVTSASNDGNITAGSSATLGSGQYFITASGVSSTVLVSTVAVTVTNTELNSAVASSTAADAAYRAVACSSRQGSTAAATVAGTRYLRLDNAAVAASADGQKALFPLKAAWFTPPAGKTLKLNLSVSFAVNDVAPTGIFTFKLEPVATVAGGVGVSAATFGTAVVGSTATFTAPAVNSDTVAESSDFTFPADGRYAISVTNDTQTVANSTVTYSVALLWRWV